MSHPFLIVIGFRVNNSEHNTSGYSLSWLEVLKFLLYNPVWVKYVVDWQLSLKIKRKNASASIFDRGVPWLTYAAIDWLNTYLQPDMKVFEYGSGGSTMYFAQRVECLVSVEHNKNWFDRVNRILQSNGISNTKLLLVEPEKKADRTMNNNKYSSFTFPKYREHNFERYVKTINDYPNSFFNLVVVDGRARVACIAESLSKIQNGGYLVLDNSERVHYKEAFDLMSEYPKKDFFGFGPLLNTFWNTTIWKINRLV